MNQPLRARVPFRQEAIPRQATDFVIIPPTTTLQSHASESKETGNTHGDLQSRREAKAQTDCHQAHDPRAREEDIAADTHL